VQIVGVVDEAPSEPLKKDTTQRKGVKADPRTHTGGKEGQVKKKRKRERGGTPARVISILEELGAHGVEGGRKGRGGEAVGLSQANLAAWRF